ncbi:zincin-like metalloproteases family protein [Actinidia rufa]|uniref:Zincin-like metalloproteases family protein n=1 Tax=Actinidia rufa TaxID=165716 RepID=A0A7J0F1R2_9ERIC|nr:zincin-like metalloproteases family protein [Actinidia rufa]
MLHVELLIQSEMADIELEKLFVALCNVLSGNYWFDRICYGWTVQPCKDALGIDIEPDTGLAPSSLLNKAVSKRRKNREYSVAPVYLHRLKQLSAPLGVVDPIRRSLLLSSLRKQYNGRLCAVYIELIVAVQAPSRTMLVGDDETFMHGQLEREKEIDHRRPPMSLLQQVPSEPPASPTKSVEPPSPSNLQRAD